MTTTYNANQLKATWDQSMRDLALTFERYRQHWAEWKARMAS